MRRHSPGEPLAAETPPPGRPPLAEEPPADAPPADHAGAIAEAKAELRAEIGDVAGLYAEVEARLRGRVGEVVAARGRGEHPVPVVSFADLEAGALGEAQQEAIRRAGCAVVRRTVDRSLAERWDAELAGYLATNHFDERYRGPEAAFFEGLAAARPMIYPVYWSIPQVQARQHEHLATTRAFLNSLWRVESEGRRWIDPERDCTFADRIRRRQPGDRSGGLSPHLDAGSVERWLRPAYRRVYRHVIAGELDRYDPFDAAYRPLADEYLAEEMTSVFRTYQGWVALSEMDGEGSLELLPIAEAFTLVWLRPLLDDVAVDDLCGAAPGRAIAVGERFHDVLLPAVTPIPAMEPGDTVWWHPDVVHAVGAVGSGTQWSNVMYVPASPWCEKNAAYLARQLPAFIIGESPPDYPAEHYEVDFDGRATPEDLTALGRRQMGLEVW